MGDKKNKKRKDRNSSDNDNVDSNNRKVFKQRGPSGDLDCNSSVSDVLNQTNAVLYDDSNESCVFDLGSVQPAADSVALATMASNSDKEPSNKDLMNCLQGISARLGALEKKLSAIEQLEKQVAGFEKELKSIWLAIEDRAKRIEERVSKMEDKVDGADIGTALLAGKVDELEKDRDHLREEEDMAIPEPGPGEVQVRMQHVGICGTDLHLYQTGMLGSISVKEPMPIGHESAGIISKLGEGVTSVKVGDRVALEPVFGCMACQVCKKGDYNLCKDVKVCGVPPKWGSMTRYFIHRAADCYKLPDHVSTEEGALLEPLTIAIHSCRRAGVCLGSKVLVLGDGPISLMVILTAKACGATQICVTGKHDNRLNVAKQLGANFCVNVGSKEPQEVADIVKNALGDMYDFSIDCIGAQSGIDTAFLATRNGGNVVIAGLRQNTITIPVLAIVGREVDIRGVMVNAHCYPIAIDMVASGLVNIKPLASHIFPLEKVNEAFEKAATKDCIKVVVKCSKD